MKLKDWMEKHNVTNEALGKKVNLHRTTISKFKTGSRIPTILDAAKIEEATKGEVSIESFNPKKK